jgi:hypothetical protein
MTQPYPANWAALNEHLKDPAMTEEQCAALLAAEKGRTKPRVQWLLRIYGKFNKLRTQRERDELAAMGSRSKKP